MRRILLQLLPKLALSRLTGLLTRIPLPRALRAPLYRSFARRYGAELDQVAGELQDYSSLAAFFARPLRAGARPLADSPLLWPCDGRVVTAGELEAQRIPQVKGREYSLADLLGEQELAAEISGGSQATVYLAPGDYHRVHSPCAAELLAIREIPGTYFPVNPPAVACIDELFLRNARVVFSLRLPGGRPAAVVMVAALNVGDTRVSASIGDHLAAGDELGRFGFGSTTVFILGPGETRIEDLEPELRVRMGEELPSKQIR
ncbi:MAG: archaetidylserine decarboxylase [Planctomycetota bacterium]